MQRVQDDPDACLRGRADDDGREDGLDHVVAHVKQPYVNSSSSAVMTFTRTTRCFSSLPDYISTAICMFVLTNKSGVQRAQQYLDAWGGLHRSHPPARSASHSTCRYVSLRQSICTSYLPSFPSQCNKDLRLRQPMFNTAACTKSPGTISLSMACTPSDRQGEDGGTKKRLRRATRDGCGRGERRARRLPAPRAHMYSYTVTLRRC